MYNKYFTLWVCLNPIFNRVFKAFWNYYKSWVILIKLFGKGQKINLQFSFGRRILVTLKDICWNLLKLYY